MSDRELRSWSAGDPEPPEDVTVVQHPNSQQYRRVSLTVMYDGVPSGRWRGWQAGPLGWPLHWSQVTDRLGGYSLTEVLPETPTPRKPCDHPSTEWCIACPDEDVEDEDDCPHCSPTHSAPETRPWGVFVSPQRDGDGQPTHLVAQPSNGAHVAQSDADWLWQLIRDYEPAAPVSVVQDDTPADGSCALYEVYTERLRVAVGGSLSQGPEDWISEAEQICAEHRGGTEVNGQPFPAVVGTDALGARLVRVANDVLGNDTNNVLDCSTAHMIATVLRELAAAEDDKPPRNPLTSGVLRASLRQLADEIEGTQG